MKRDRSLLTFAVLGALCFVISTLGFDVGARIAVSRQAPFSAMSQSLHYMTVEPLGTFLLLAPFVAIVGLSVWVARASSGAIAAGFFCLFMLVIGWLYFVGHWESQEAMQRRHWTAAALSMGLLPFMSIPVVLVAAVAGGVIMRMRRHRNQRSREDLDL